MSDDSLAIAQRFAAAQAASTRQTLQTQFVRQQATADQRLVALLEQSAQPSKAALPAGQGRSLDISA